VEVDQAVEVEEVDSSVEVHQEVLQQPQDQLQHNKDPQSCNSKLHQLVVE